MIGCGKAKGRETKLFKIMKKRIEENSINLVFSDFNEEMEATKTEEAAEQGE
jgi:hypothetical protein